MTTPWLQRHLASTATTLAAMRIIVASQALWMVLSRDPAGVAAAPPLIWEAASPSERWRFLLVPGLSGFETILWAVCVAGLVGVLLGAGTRVCGLVSAIILYHQAALLELGAQGRIWGKGVTIATLILPVLSATPCDDRWSLAAWQRRAVSRDPTAYGVPAALIRWLFAQVYLLSGITKLRSSGLGWVSARTIRTHLLVAGAVDPLFDTSLNAWIVAHPTIAAALAGGTLAFELLFVTGVFWRGARVPLMIAGVLFHAGLWVTLGYRFLNLPHLLLFADLPDRHAGEARGAGAGQA